MKKWTEILIDQESLFTVEEFDRLVAEYGIPKKPKNDREKFQLFMTLVAHANACELTVEEQRHIKRWLLNPRATLRRLFDPTYDAYPREIVVTMTGIIAILCGTNLLLMLLLCMRGG